MAKKEKEKKPVLNLDGKEYIIENMTEEQKKLAGKVVINQNHVNDIQNKQRTNQFVAEQLSVGHNAFVNMLKESLSKEEESEDK